MKKLLILALLAQATLICPTTPAEPKASIFKKAKIKIKTWFRTHPCISTIIVCSAIGFPLGWGLGRISYSKHRREQDEIAAWKNIKNCAEQKMYGEEVAYPFNSETIIEDNHRVGIGWKVAKAWFSQLRKAWNEKNYTTVIEFCKKRINCISKRHHYRLARFLTHED